MCTLTLPTTQICSRSPCWGDDSGLSVIVTVVGVVWSQSILHVCAHSSAPILTLASRLFDLADAPKKLRKVGWTVFFVCVLLVLAMHQRNIQVD